MDTQLEKDISKIKDFVKHSAEFIAYFELADTKIQDWHAKIEAEIYQQGQRHEAQIAAIETQIQQLPASRIFHIGTNDFYNT